VIDPYLFLLLVVLVATGLASYLTRGRR